MDTRRRILEKAREAFATRGYAATPLELLARELGLTKGAIYHHFPSKGALLTALLEESLRQAEAALMGEGTLAERLFAYAESYRRGIEPLTALSTSRGGRRGGDTRAFKAAHGAMLLALERLSSFLEDYAPGRGRELGAVFFSIVHGAYALDRHVPGYPVDRVLKTGIEIFVRGLEAARPGGKEEP